MTRVDTRPLSVIFYSTHCEAPTSVAYTKESAKGLVAAQTLFTCHKQWPTGMYKRRRYCLTYRFPASSLVSLCNASFSQRAAEIEAVDPKVAYYCRLYAVEQAKAG